MKGQVYMQASKAKNIYKQTKKGTNNHILGLIRVGLHGVTEIQEDIIYFLIRKNYVKNDK